MGEITNFPAGVSSFGVPLLNDGGRPVESGKARHFWVDSAHGHDGHDGSEPQQQAVATITRALALVALKTHPYSGVGCVIHLLGSFNESVTVLSTLYAGALTFRGEGTGPDRTVWTAPVDGVCLTLNAVADCVVENIRFRPPAYIAGVPAAISLVGASNWTMIRNCRFQGKAGSWYAILSDGNQDNVHILNNEFFYMNTPTYGTAIKGAVTAGVNATGWVIAGNIFHSNLNHVVVPMGQGHILRNYFAANGLTAAGVAGVPLTVLGVDIHGAAIGCNIVTQNQLSGLYHQANYYGGLNDDWNGNYCTDRSHATQVDATTGLSILPPAA